MKKKTRKTFSPEFRLETAQLVVDQQYTQEEAAKATALLMSDSLTALVNRETRSEPA